MAAQSPNRQLPSVKLLILFGVELLFVFDKLARASQRELGLLVSGAGRVQSRVHGDRRTGGRQSRGLSGGGGAAGVRPAGVHRPAREEERLQ